MSPRPIIAIASLVILAGGVLLQLLVILSGAVSGSPEEKFYFLSADTSGIGSAPATSAWTFFSLCALTGPSSGSGSTTACGGATAALPFDLQRNFGSTGDIAASSSQYYYLSRTTFAFYLIALFFSAIALLSGLLAICTRLGSYLSGLLSFVAFFFQALAAALMTAWTVKGRNAFLAAGRAANLGRYSYGLTWGAVAAFFISVVLFFVAGAAGKEKTYQKKSRFGTSELRRCTSAFGLALRKEEKGERRPAYSLQRGHVRCKERVKREFLAALDVVGHVVGAKPKDEEGVLCRPGRGNVRPVKGAGVGGLELNDLLVEGDAVVLDRLAILVGVVGVFLDRAIPSRQVVHQQRRQVVVRLQIIDPLGVLVCGTLEAESIRISQRDVIRRLVAKRTEIGVGHGIAKDKDIVYRPPPPPLRWPHIPYVILDWGLQTEGNARKGNVSIGPSFVHECGTGGAAGEAGTRSLAGFFVQPPVEPQEEASGCILPWLAVIGVESARAQIAQISSMRGENTARETSDAAQPLDTRRFVGANTRHGSHDPFGAPRVDRTT
ncbi:hypothetical protein FH972_024022 [Carpinus fangiana]|uniref:Uncharacterized protein n=1 Tax=Carpinus fangiana TaxID=176857 RepID=A0A5N6KZB3_9ROSI|nr:hypothetical protein FH972_024022 [Carpinus fangiana]